MLVRMGTERDRDELFPALDQNSAVKKDVLDVLVWRDSRLKDIMNFTIILEQMDRVEEFAEFDLRMKKSA